MWSGQDGKGGELGRKEKKERIGHERIALGGVSVSESWQDRGSKMLEFSISSAGQAWLMRGWSGVRWR